MPVDDKDILQRKRDSLRTFSRKSNAAIIEQLKSTNHLVASEKIVHPVSPLLEMQGSDNIQGYRTMVCINRRLRKEAIDAIGTVKWIPDWGQERITGNG